MTILSELFKDKEYFQQEDKDYAYEPTGTLQKQIEKKLEEFQQRSIEQDSEINSLKMQLEKQALLTSQLSLRLSELQEQFEVFKKQRTTEEVIEIRDISMEQIKEEILILMSDGKTRYFDEIATELRIDIANVAEAFKELQQEGKLFIDGDKI